MKYGMICVIMLLSLAVGGEVYSQSVRSGNSEPITFGIKPAAINSKIRLLTASRNHSATAGESGGVELVLTNTGGKICRGLRSEIRLPEELSWITFSSRETVTDVPPGDSVIVRFDFSLLETAPTRDVPFIVTLTFHDGTTKTVTSPPLSVMEAKRNARLHVSVAPEEVLMTAGEEQEVVVTLTNAGNKTARDVVMRLIPAGADPCISIVGETGPVDVSSSRTETRRFRIKAAGRCRASSEDVVIEAAERNGSEIARTSCRIRIKEQVVARDVTGPMITIVEPILQRPVEQRGIRVKTKKEGKAGEGEAITTSSSTIQIRGGARDTGGVSAIWIKNKEVLDIRQVRRDSIIFQHEAPLLIGENRIEIRAIDGEGNESVSELRVWRETSFIKGKNYALIISVQAYKDKKWPKLGHPNRDADKLAKVLMDEYGFLPENVIRLKDPDRKGILMRFKELEQQTTADDQVLIFFAGHGMYDEKAGTGYWIPINEQGDFEAEWISNEDVRNAMKKIDSKHLLLISDACFAGSIFTSETRSSSNLEPIVADLYSHPSRRAITSGLKNEEVPDQSFLIEALVRELRENASTYIYAQKLFLAVKERIFSEHGRSFSTPEYGKIEGLKDAGGGDFIFVKR